MKTLFYNPMEIPEKVRLISNCLGVNLEYETSNTNKPVWMHDLFDLAKSEAFDEVKVFFSEEDEAYIKNSKTAFDRKEVIGWFSLKGIGNGGGYLQDKTAHLYALMQKAKNKNT